MTLHLSESAGILRCQTVEQPVKPWILVYIRARDMKLETKESKLDK
jgi:hypothetical protein